MSENYTEALLDYSTLYSWYGCNLPSLLRNEIKQCFTLLLVHFQILHRFDGAASLPWQNISCSVLFYKKGPAGQRQRLVKVCVLYEFLNQTKQNYVIASLLSFHATCCIFILFWSMTMTGCKKNCVFLSKIRSDVWNITIGMFALSNTIPRMICYGSIRSGDFQQHSY